MDYGASLILIFTIFGIHIAAWFTPGPIFLLILRNTLIYGAGRNIWTALGVSMGNIIHTTYAVITLMTVSSLSEKTLGYIQILGSAYLIYLGMRTLLHARHREKSHSHPGANNTSRYDAWKEGFFTNLLSPKASIFFLSIFSTVIGSGVPYWVVGVLWIGLPINSFLMAVFVGYIFSLPIFSVFYDRFASLVHIVLGLLMVLLGVFIFF